MSISGAMNISLSGIQAQTRKVSAAANNIANVTTPGYSRLETQFTSISTGGVSTAVTQSTASSNVDLASEMIDIIGAEISFKANAAAFETGADMWDVLMTIKRD
jgi:flagellar hook protein FlgE